MTSADARGGGGQRRIDAHIHVWDTARAPYPWRGGEFRDLLPQRYLFDDLLRDALGSVDGFVFVQAEMDHRVDPVLETAWVQEIADSHADGSRLLGIVAYADLLDPDVAHTLDRHLEHPLVCGVRQELWWRRRPPRADYRDSDAVAEPPFRDGLAALADRGLSFDVTADPGQLVQIADVLAAVPDVSVVVDHMGLPSNDAAQRDMWRRGMRRIAARPNAAVKISGFFPFGRHWTVEDLEPLVSEIVEIFGPDRCMLASNFPVDGMVRTYAGLWRDLAELVERLAPAHAADFFSGAAERFYGLRLR